MANESYNPYSQQIEQNKLPWYISETFINSVEIRSPFIAGNKWYIWWTLQVWQNWIVIDWSQKIIRSINYKENESWWIIKWNWDSEFNNVTVRWNILWWKTSYSDSTAWYWLWLDWWVPKFNLWNSTNSYLNWDWNNLNIRWNLILPDWTSVEDITVDRSTLSWIPYFMNTNVAPSWSWLKLTSSYLWFYNWSQWKTYMDNTWWLYLSWSWSNYLSWNWSTLVVRWDIQATSATFNYAWSNSQWWNANDTNFVNWQSASTVATWWVRASNALSLNNRYINWLSAWEMASATLPSSWVVIWSQWIIWRKSWVTTFEIQASTWDAYFRWNIYAESWTFTWNITSSATITWWIIQSATSWSRIELSSTNWFRVFDPTWNVRIRMPTDWSWITFFNQSWGSVWRIQWITVSWWTFSGFKFLNLDNNWISWDWNFSVDNIFANKWDAYLSIWWTSYTTYCLWKLKIPVWTNLY